MIWRIVYLDIADDNFLLMPEGSRILLLEGKGLGAVSQSVVEVKHTHYHCLPPNENQQIQW